MSLQLEPVPEMSTIPPGEKAWEAQCGLALYEVTPNAWTGHKGAPDKRGTTQSCSRENHPVRFFCLMVRGWLPGKLLSQSPSLGDKEQQEFVCPCGAGGSLPGQPSSNHLL